MVQRPFAAGFAALVFSAVMSGAVSGQAPQQAAPSEAPDPIYEPGDGVTRPTVLSSVPIQVETPGERAEIRIRCVVGKDGLVRNIDILRPASKSLNDAAVRALKQWRFAPGMRNGQPVSVFTRVEFSFS